MERTQVWADNQNVSDNLNAILVVMCDQLRAREVGCRGNDVIRAPSVDRWGRWRGETSSSRRKTNT